MDLVHLLASWLRSLFHFLICMKFAQFLATSCSERICADFVEVRMTEYCDNHFDMTMCKTCFCVCFLKLERERERKKHLPCTFSFSLSLIHGICFFC